MKTQRKELLSHLAIILFFVAISFAYFYPTIKGEVLKQSNETISNAITKETRRFQKTEHRDIAWTNSVYAGIPSYQRGGISDKNIFSKLLRLFNHKILPYGTVSALFLFLLGFYILLLSLKFNKWISFVGAIGFAFSSFNFITIASGDLISSYAIGLIPIVMAGIILIYDKKYYLGIIILLIGSGLQLSTGKLQFIYYTILLAGIYIIFKFFWSFKDKHLNLFAKSTALTLLVCSIAVLPNIATLWQQIELSQYNAQNKSEIKKSEKEAENYEGSYGISESLSLLIPNIKGGKTAYIGQNKIAMKKIDSQYKTYIQQQDQYWGKRPFSEGAFYFGAIILFLSVLAMFIVKDRIKWWLFSAAIISIILSWGNNISFLTDFFVNYFPFYNKFKSFSSILAIASFSMPLLAFLGIKEIIEDKENFRKNIKYLWISLGLTAGIAFIFYLIPNFFHFLTGEEQSYFHKLMQESPDQKNQINAFLEQLQTARIAIFKTDAIRSVIYILLGAVSLFLFAKLKNFKISTLLAVIGILILIDLWTVDRRYLNETNFETKTKAKLAYKESNAVKFILKDQDPYFRVLDITKNPFYDATTAFYLKSIGGHQEITLRRYQDIISKYLSPYSQLIAQAIQDSTENVSDYLKQMQVLNMLNTKYIIYDGQKMPIINTFSYGNAWFIDNFKTVNSANEAINALSKENLRRTAIINKNRFNVHKLPLLSYSDTQRGNIQLSVYKPDRLIFKVNAKQKAFIVFSDIYYPKGWHAKIDGKETKIYQTDYILRGLIVPAGNHIIKFEFVPNSVFEANKYASAGSVFVILLLIILFYILYKDKKRKKIE